MTKDEVHNIMAYYASVEEKQYGRYLYETYYYRFGTLSRHGVRVEYDQLGRVLKVDDAPPVPPQDLSKIGRAHVWTPVTSASRMPSSALKKKQRRQSLR